MNELSLEQVEQIRKEARTPGNSYAAVAAKWAIDVGHVRFIANRDRK